MILRTLNTISILFLLLGFQVNAQEAMAILQDKEIRIGDQTTLEIRLTSAADGKEVEFPTLIDTISGKIEIVKISDIDTSYDENDISIRVLSQVITITSWDSGYHAIPPFVFKIEGEEFKTEAQLLAVSSVSIEPEADIKDIKAIMEVPFSLWDWILVNKFKIGGIITILLLIALGIFLLKRFKREKPIEQVFVPKEEADVVALRQLRELEMAKLWQNGKVNPYYTQISHILREYLENRFQLSALERTTDEIDLLLKYHKELDERKQAQLVELLRVADMAKFAKQEPLPSENEEAIKYAYLFIEETRLVIVQKAEENEEKPSIQND